MVSGNLDGILVKPINELLQLYGKGIGDVGGVFIGLVIIIRFINISQISIIRLLLIIIPMTFMNILIFVCLFTIVASLSFWFENISNSFVIAKLQDGSIGISCRSNDDNINMKEIMLTFGGGGNKNRAGANIKNETINNIYDRIKDIAKSL